MSKKTAAKAKPSGEKPKVSGVRHNVAVALAAKPAAKKPAVSPAKLKVPAVLKSLVSKDAAPVERPGKTPKVAAENKTAFVLRTGTPKPPKIRPDAGQSMYPFASMTRDTDFFVAAGIDASKYADETEAKKAQMEKCHTLSNRLTGAVRRFTKKNSGYKFTVRIVNDPELGYGVTVWCDEDGK